jgi:hypothetical protein
VASSPQCVASTHPPHLEDASGSFHPGGEAPPRDKRVGERRINEVDRNCIIKQAAFPRASKPTGRGPQFSSQPGGNLVVPLAETAGPNSDPDADGEAPLG